MCQLVYIRRQQRQRIHQHLVSLKGCCDDKHEKAIFSDYSNSINQKMNETKHDVIDEL